MSDLLNLENWRQNSETFQFKDLTLFVKDTKTDKPVMLFIHGFPTASIDWQPLWASVSQHFRCIALDLLGFGDSSKPLNRDITLMEQAQICRELLASKNIKDAHLFCHDYGDTVGQELLAGVKDKSSFTPLSCIFLNGGLFPWIHRPRLIQKLLMTPFGPIVAKLTSYKRFSTTLSNICTQPISEHDLKIYWQLMEQNEGKRMLPALIRYMAERKTHATRWGQATEQPPCPTLLINGVDDPISGGHLADEYEKRVEKAQIVRLADTGHYPQVERPHEVISAANDFWKMNNFHD